MPPVQSVLRQAVRLLLIAAALLGAGCNGSPADETAAPAVPPARTRTVTPVAQVASPRPSGPLEPGTSCISSGCHATFATAPRIHGVLRASGNCSVCHQADQGEHVYPLKRAGNATCTFCHDSVIGQRVHQHGATDMTCTVCHDAHASDHVSLLRASSPSTLCGTCHPQNAHTFQHEPFAAGECTACHDPHESNYAKLLRGGADAEHCYLCHGETHDAMVSAKHVHAPAAQSCLTCHQPHGSDHAHVLNDAVDTVCFSCHADVEQMIADAEAPHGALLLKDRCSNCHDAHASSEPSLLKDRQDVLCLQCHGEVIVANDGREIPDMTASIRDREFLHGPVESGQCSACHTLHGGTHSRLLRENFTEDFYTSFDLSQYALCFECHENSLVTEERTDALTNFRNGDVNLHYLHVNRQTKGRTCRTCHEIHGSELPAHVAESVPFGTSNWPLPIGFEKTATGGSCGPGCHQRLDYDRVEPISWPSRGQPDDQGESP